MSPWPDERASKEGELDKLMAAMSEDERQTVAWVFRCHNPLTLGHRAGWVRWYANHYRWNPIEGAA